MSGPDRPLLGLPGVGPRTAERLEAAGLSRLEDLLLFLPRRYDDAGSVQPIASLRPGAPAYVEGKVVRAAVKRFFRRATLEVTIEDAAGDAMKLRWFRFRGAVPPRFTVGNRVRTAGLVRQGKVGLELVQPIAEAVDGSEGRVQAIRPRYRRIAGVPQQLIERLIAIATEAAVVEPHGVPPELPGLGESARVLHVRPPLPEGDARAALLAGRSPAHRRAAFEELLLLRLAIRRTEELPRGRALVAAARAEAALHPILAALPFSPTAAQRRAIDDLARDLALDRPMRRLLTGDVGSGKTLVAAAAVELCCASGGRAALLAPTALLAEQQFEALAGLLAPTGRRVALVHAGVARAARAKIEAALADREGALDVVVGTHALLDRGLRIAGLSLVIVDEQQRFGVLQRAALADNAQDGVPHQLALSATPIPRTLALALRGALELSHLDERPPGRRPVETALIEGRDRALFAVRDELGAGGQVYWICPRIEDEEGGGVVETAAWLAEGLGRPVHLCHGAQPAAERTRQLRAFRAEGGLLVATTVVEVGLDIPAATLVVIESPELLGLSQLHQLRGRVGRGERAGRCLLCVTRLGPSEAERVALLVAQHDGLAIAEADLARRGMGDLAGVEQSGLPSLPPLPAEELAVLAEHADRAAVEILAVDATLTEPRHARLSRALARRGGEQSAYDSA